MIGVVLAAYCRLALASPSATSVLEALAADEDVGVRRRAIAALIRSSTEPAGGTWSQRARFDPSEYVQRAMIDALAPRTGEPETVAVLTELLDAADVDPWTRGLAGLKLVNVPGARDRIVSAAAAVSDDGKAGGLLIAAARAGDGAALARLSPWFAGGNLPLERQILAETGGLNLPFAQAMGRAEPEVRLVLAGALLVTDPHARAPMRAALRDPVERDDAVEVLESLPGKAAIALLRGTPGPSARLALVRKGAGTIAPALVVLRGKDRELGRLAAAALAHRSEPAARAALRAHLRDESDPLREASAAALALQPAAIDCDALRPLLTDEDAYLRLAAAEATLVCDIAGFPQGPPPPPPRSDEDIGTR